MKRRRWMAAGVGLVLAQSAAAREPARWTNDAGMVFALIPAGEFVMGAGGDPLAPPHRVRITRPFYLSVTEVTQKQYSDIVGRNPSAFGGGDRDSHPVEQVNHAEARTFCEKLTARGQGTFRLPTEAEWEYACRAGGGADDPADVDRQAWHVGNSGGETHPVATREPNAWGLYDMRGNVWEWVQDFVHAYPAGGVAVDPVADAWAGKKKHEQGIIRGGAWSVGPDRCGCAVRVHVYQRLCWAPFIGFRVVREAEEGER